MLLYDIRILFAFLPLFLLITAFVPRKMKPALLAIGGAVYCSFYGWIKLLITALSAIIGWFSVRCCPRTMTGKRAAKAKAWIAIDITAQLILLYFSRGEGCLLTLIPAIQSIAAILQRINGKFRAPSLLNYLAYCFSLPRILGGIPLDFSERTEVIQKRKVSIERIADGIQHMVVGIFKINVLSIPISHFYSMVYSLQQGNISSMPDAWMYAFALFFMIIFTMQGIMEIGQGMLLVLGYGIADSFEVPIFSASLREYCESFWKPMYHMMTRIFGITDENRNHMNMVSWGIRSAGTVFLIAWIFRKSSLAASAVFIGFALVFLLLERILEQTLLLDRIPRIVRIIVTNICIVFLCFTLFFEWPFGKISGLFSFIGKNGFLLSSFTKYAFTSYWSTFLLCIVCLFPIRKMASALCSKYEKLEKASIIAIPLAELGMLILSIMQILGSDMRI